MQWQQNLYPVRDQVEAAMLLTLDFKMHPIRPATKLKAERGDQVMFHFEPVSSQGRKIEEVLGLWRSGGSAMARANPLEPLTWMRCMAENLAFLGLLLKNTREQCHLVQGDKSAIIDPSSPDPVILQKMGL